MCIVANGEETRDEATEGGAKQEGSCASNLCVVGGEGVLGVRHLSGFAVKTKVPDAK